MLSDADIAGSRGIAGAFAICVPCPHLAITCLTTFLSPLVMQLAGKTGGKPSCSSSVLRINAFSYQMYSLIIILWSSKVTKESVKLK